MFLGAVLTRILGFTPVFLVTFLASFILLAPTSFALWRSYRDLSEGGFFFLVVGPAMSGLFSRIG
jgi:hypothetical protein